MREIRTLRSDHGAMPGSTFVMTAELGGLGRACTRLNLSQPAASRQIHALEADLGVRLLAGSATASIVGASVSQPSAPA